ncbi:MipA/OmpV family protein [Rubrivivax sp. JA1029]|uniref:MipA/OmpV family protein n=1 Tax=Rubrivivax sp. JA1029 TaxID=2894193 RepID=UPI001E655DE9|nr:MipA/OmpV family protein [Rubrivivax sp. JA1029]MCC9647761.1 MipA/OmpV family protein [Rubrivivax sp. JA1029]
MKLRSRPPALALTLLVAASARGEEAPVPPVTPRAPAAEADDDGPPPRRFEGVVGVLASWGSSHHGRGGPDASLEPGFYLRWGRLTVSNAGAFATRRADDVTRGLGLDLTSGSRLRTHLSLRYDRGRDDDEPALEGLGDVRATVRARLGASWRLDDGWRLSGGWSLDLLGRGGGSFVDLGLSRERPLAPRTRWNASLRLTAADRRYMQSYYGIGEQQAATSGYPVYSPGAGLRDLQGVLGLRHQLSEDWVALAGVSLRRLLGPAADGPSVTGKTGWSLGFGLGRRF